MKRKLCCLLGVIAFITTAVQAQQVILPSPGEKTWKMDEILSTGVPKFFEGYVKGSVKDQGGQPIPGAAVYIVQLGMGTTTTPTGQYAFSLVPGTYTIQASYPGCGTASAPLVVLDGWHHIIDFELICITFQSPAQ